MAGSARAEDSVDPEVEVSEEEAPEDDFFEADASAELTEDEDQGGEEYETEDEEVSLDVITIMKIWIPCPTMAFIR
jgi:hypothetical protein